MKETLSWSDSIAMVWARLLPNGQLLELMMSGGIKQSLMLAPLWRYFYLENTAGPHV